jgi:two-component system, sensor histidine kinase and response regulator
MNPILDNESIGVIALSKENNYIKNKSENTLYTYFTLISVMALSLFLAYREMISRKNTELFNEQLNNAQKISKSVTGTLIYKQITYIGQMRYIIFLK